MPYQFVIGDSRNLFNALSDLIFAEISLAGGGGLDDARKRLFLADGQQLHRLGATARIHSSFRQQISDFSQVFRDSNHVLLPVLRYTRLKSEPGYGKSGCPL